MSIEKDELRQLMAQYVSGTIRPVDLDRLLDYVSLRHKDSDLDAVMQEVLEEMTVDDELFIDTASLYQRITTHPKFNEGSMKKTTGKWWWLSSVAASLLLGMGLFFYYQGDGYKGDDLAPVSSTEEVLHTVTSSPSDRPILRLADGTEIDLDQVAEGLLATENGMQISLKGTELHYEGDVADTETSVIKNTIITPKGRQYQVLLPDGTKLWLNTATTITYPVKFAPDIREVEISGEAYFEVQKAADWPFIVSAKNQVVEVLGTRFNISAYEDDVLTKTTLVEGRVKVSLMQDLLTQSSDNSTVLSPGQQAIIPDGIETIKINHIETEEVVSWKSNLFVFFDEEISEVMKKVSRWYDVEVEYRDGMAGKRIGGTIPRFEQLSELMDALEATGLLHYQMKGGKILIMK